MMLSVATCSETCLFKRYARCLIEQIDACRPLCTQIAVVSERPLTLALCCGWQESLHTQGTVQPQQNAAQTDVIVSDIQRSKDILYDFMGFIVAELMFLICFHSFACDYTILTVLCCPCVAISEVLCPSDSDREADLKLMGKVTLIHLSFIVKSVRLGAIVAFVTVSVRFVHKQLS